MSSLGEEKCKMWFHLPGMYSHWVFGEGERFGYVFTFDYDLLFDKTYPVNVGNLWESIRMKCAKVSFTLVITLWRRRRCIYHDIQLVRSSSGLWKVFNVSWWWQLKNFISANLELLFVVLRVQNYKKRKI